MFDSPTDRIIWDVGHQAYVHKLITGRRDTFDSLRTLGGVSGYPSRAESPHDHVENSHASTALSYALGLAIAAEDQGEERWTVAVIGDGALTGGMAYEALSHIAVRRPRRLLIVLNDNGMSYQATVGGVAASLAGVRLDRRYEWVKRTIGRVLRSVPLVGETADELARRLKESLKQLIEPSTVFDAMGIKYAGTVDGHDLASLEETLVRAKALDEPVVIRVQTEKGRGYPPAIADEVDRLHAVGAFDVGTGRPLKEERKLTDVAGAALLEAARRRPDVVAISAAMVSSTGLQDMETEMPERVIDTGICEQHSVTLAAGLAMGGLRPVVAIYSTFLQRALDQIVSDVALHDLPVTFLVDRSGVTGPDGPSHHGVFDLTFLRMVPNMVVGAPADADELCSMIETALDHPGPIAIRFPKAAGSAIPSLPAPALPVGRWDEVRPGTRCPRIGGWPDGGTGAQGGHRAGGPRSLLSGDKRPLGQAARSPSRRVGGRARTGAHHRGQRGQRRFRRRRARGAIGARHGREGEGGSGSAMSFLPPAPPTRFSAPPGSMSRASATDPRADPVRLTTGWSALIVVYQIDTSVRWVGTYAYTGYTGSAPVWPGGTHRECVLSGPRGPQPAEQRSLNLPDSIVPRRHHPAPPVMFAVRRTTEEGAR